MSPNLLYIPYRKTQRIQFSATLRNIITSDFLQTPTIFERDLTEIDTLRNDIIDLGISKQDLALLKRYYLHLASLQVKFPGDVEEFPWFGTIGYNVTGPVKIKSILFERINILYNIAALYSQLGYQEDKSNNEGLKKSCVFFQYAASYLQYINKMIQTEIKEDGLKLPLDLQSDLILALYYLSLAQAQEVFWLKAVNDNTKDTLVSRLSLQVSSYYDLALQQITKSDGFRTEWIHHITVKKFHFEAAAEYRSALVSVAAAKYGEEVARLGKAVKLVRSISTSLRFVNDTVREEFEGLAGVVEETYRSAERDNDLIYLQDVPSARTLAKISPAPAVKCLDIIDIMQPLSTLQNTTDYGEMLFKDLLPFTVVQTADSFRERQEEFISSRITTPLRTLTTMLRRFLVERQLPGSIDAINQPVSLPKNIIEISQEVRSQGGVQSVLKSLEDLVRMNQNGKSLIEDTKRRLAIESNEDSILRSRQGSAYWTRGTSEVAGKEYIDRISQLENFMAQAEAGDEIIRKTFFEIQSNLSILALPEEELTKYIPTSKPSSELDPKLNSLVTQLKSLLDQEKTLEQQRELHIELIDIKSRKAPILPKIISEYKTIQRTKPGIKPTHDLFESTFEKHMSIFDEDFQFVESEKIKQRDLEAQISQAHVRFQIELERSESGLSPERQRVISELESTYSKFKELIEHITEGLNFYQDFTKNALTLSNDVEAFVTKRRIQARDLEMELSSKFQRLIINNSSGSINSAATNDTSNNQSKSKLIASESTPSISTSDFPERIHSPIPRRVTGNNPNFVIESIGSNEDLVKKTNGKSQNQKGKSHVWNPSSGIKFD